MTVADKRTGSGWRSLTASELQQMTGRAGRRGKDYVGFIVAAPGVHQDPQRIAELLAAPPDPLESQFRAADPGGLRSSHLNRPRPGEAGERAGASAGKRAADPARTVAAMVG